MAFDFEEEYLLVSDGQLPHGPSVQVIDLGDGIGAEAVVFEKMLEGRFVAVFIVGLVEGNLPISFHTLAKVLYCLISGDYAEIFEEFVFGLASETVKATIN